MESREYLGKIVHIVHYNIVDSTFDAFMTQRIWTPL